ncbi:MAG: FecR domain-containing protein, partial [Syntrophaceae bacterium]|nr:FecR domain-containing protein [Syntrophaceae bacterium]
MKRHFLILLFTLSVFFCVSQILSPQSGHALERGAGITEEALPDTLKEVEIKKSFIGSKAREVGSIQTLTGSAIVAHGDLAEAYFALPGDKIYEKDRIFTLSNTRCRLKFIDENVITMGANAEIGVEEIVADLGLGEKKSLFSMTKGKAMFYALKMFRYRKATMDVQTVTAVIGVRGTKFGIEVRQEKEGNLASRPLYLADASDNGWIRLVQNANSDTVTTVFSFDGQVSVTSTVDNRTQTVAPGQMLSSTTRGSGVVQTTPPQVSRQFQSDTEAPHPPEEETTKESGTEKGESPEGTEEAKQDDQEETETDDSPAETDETTPMEEIATTTVNTTDLAQQQTSHIVETKEDPIKDPRTNASGTDVG